MKKTTYQRAKERYEKYKHNFECVYYEVNGPSGQKKPLWIFPDRQSFVLEENPHVAFEESCERTRKIKTRLFGVHL